MFKWLKKWGVDIALGCAKKFATVDQLTEWIVAGVNALIAKATANVDPEKMERVCATCSKVSALCGTLSTALADRVVSDEEAQRILRGIREIVSTSVLTDERLQALVDELGEKIKERL